MITYGIMLQLKTTMLVIARGVRLTRRSLSTWYKRRCHMNLKSSDKLITSTSATPACIAPTTTCVSTSRTSPLARTATSLPAAMVIITTNATTQARWDYHIWTGTHGSITIPPTQSSRHHSIESEDKSGSGDDGDDVRFLHPADPATVRMDHAHRAGILHYCVSITFTAAAPFTKNHYRNALSDLVRKVPPLTMCLREKDDCLWVCEMRDFSVNLQMIEGGDVRDEMKRLLKAGVKDSCNGPPWKASVLVHEGEEGRGNCEGGVRRSDGGMEDYEGGSDGGGCYTATISLLFHHGLIDGSSAFVVMQTLLEILTAMVSGGTSDLQPVGYMVRETHTRVLTEAAKTLLESEPLRLANLKEQRLHQTYIPLVWQAFGAPVGGAGRGKMSGGELGVEGRDGSAAPTGTLILEAFGSPEVSQPDTLILPNTLMQGSTLLRFARSCKVAGVTFNTGFTAALNVALVRLVRFDGGLVKDEYEVTSRHLVNLRRYWPRHSKEIDTQTPQAMPPPSTTPAPWPFGCHMSGLLHTIATPHGINDFWEFATTIEHDLRSAIKSCAAIEELALKELLQQDRTNDVFIPSAVVCDYNFSNLLSGSTLLSTDSAASSPSSSLIPTSILTFSPHPGSEYALSHIITPIGGEVTHSMSFANTFMAEGVAHRLLHHISVVIVSLVS